MCVVIMEKEEIIMKFASDKKLRFNYNLAEDIIEKVKIK